MTDREILDIHNNILQAIRKRRGQEEYVAFEIPPGKPQLEYSKRGNQWVQRGDVLRCVINDGGINGECTVTIDDRELSLREFGRCLTTFAGWGMQIVFVPDDEIERPPTTICMEPPEKDMLNEKDD